jgi:non-ribosomal peptide synthetase component F
MRHQAQRFATGGAFDNARSRRRSQAKQISSPLTGNVMAGSTQSVRTLVDRRATASPHATYLVSPETGRELTFLGLRQQALSVAELLHSLDLAPGDGVALLVPNSLLADVPVRHNLPADTRPDGLFQCPEGRGAGQ